MVPKDETHNIVLANAYTYDILMGTAIGFEVYEEPSAEPPGQHWAPRTMGSNPLLIGSEGAPDAAASDDASDWPAARSKAPVSTKVHHVTCTNGSL